MIAKFRLGNIEELFGENTSLFTSSNIDDNLNNESPEEFSFTGGFDNTDSNT